MIEFKAGFPKGGEDTVQITVTSADKPAAEEQEAMQRLLDWIKELDENGGIKWHELPRDEPEPPER